MNCVSAEKQGASCEITVVMRWSLVCDNNKLSSHSVVKMMIIAYCSPCKMLNVDDDSGTIIILLFTIPIAHCTDHTR